ncbi:MAG: viroplasmin family protein [Saprospiraceae bacterium]|nr:viroplasmin family protein [Saprospiraceae bacterium]
MSKGNKYYVVWIGNKPGIYHNWEECQLQIKGYPQAKYKSYKTLDEAKYALVHGDTVVKATKKPATGNRDSAIIWKSISVDAACSGNPGIMEYRGVDTKSQQEIFRQGPFIDGTNNIGEFLALVHALAYLKKKGLVTYPIYTDSKTALAWVRNKKAKTTLAKNAKNRHLFELLDRAQDWLGTNNYQNPIIKWNTEKWGEIPADFGRK